MTYSLSYIQKLLMKAVNDTFICENCKASLESDAEQCGLCGWINPLVKGGWI